MVSSESFISHSYFVGFQLPLSGQLTEHSFTGQPKILCGWQNQRTNHINARIHTGEQVHTAQVYWCSSMIFPVARGKYITWLTRIDRFCSVQISFYNFGDPIGTSLKCNHLESLEVQGSLGIPEWRKKIHHVICAHDRRHLFPFLMKVLVSTCRRSSTLLIGPYW